MPRGTVAGTAGIVLSLLGLALIAGGAIVMTRHALGLGLALVGGGFALVVAGSVVSSRARPSGKA